MTYQEILDYIYADFMEIKHKIKGKGDAEIRNPNLLVNLMNELDIIPDKNKIIKITGSKGKGTTTRICENMIRAVNPKLNVAILTSPEEIEHNDRMRINNIPISISEFENTFNELKPRLEKLKQSFSGFDYLSPSGLFVLIAFYWWKDKGIDYFVLETGRGAEYDEVGIIPAKVSIVSSILLEHPQYLGGSLESIAKHKLFVCNNSDYAVLDKTATPYFNGYTAELLNPANEVKIDNFPDWYSNNVILALPAVAKLLNQDEEKIKQAFVDFKDKTSASFGFKNKDGVNYYYEPAISLQSLDMEFIKSIANEKTMFLVSFPDDKDIHPMVNELKSYGDLKHIVLTGTRGYLDYNITQKDYKDDIIWTGKYNDTNSFNKMVKELDYKNIYTIGTQTYIRLVKCSLFDY
ncbi:MAG: hypothetical protein ACPG8V_02630 [Alphaproteobacteria bacterium]